MGRRGDLVTPARAPELYLLSRRGDDGTDVLIGAGTKRDLAVLTVARVVEHLKSIGCARRDCPDHGGAVLERAIESENSRYRIELAPART